MHFKCRLENGGQFVSASMYVLIKASRECEEAISYDKLVVKQL